MIGNEEFASCGRMRRLAAGDNADVHAFEHPCAPPSCQALPDRAL
jgi:hypothetical protein